MRLHKEEWKQKNTLIFISIQLSEMHGIGRVKISISQNYHYQNSTQTTKLKPNQTLFGKTYPNLIIFFDQKILKYFTSFKNPNVSVLWLKWTQTMEMKQNQTFLHGAYSNLTSFLFHQKQSILMTFKIAIFQFYDWSEPKQWKLIKIRHFPIGYIRILHYFSLVAKY